MDRHVSRRVDEMRASLSELGVSVTRRRAKALEVLASADSHPSANEIHAEVRRWHPSTSLATIYNTIELLKDAGQILELEFSGAANRYDGRRPAPHPHLVCLTCEEIEDMEDADDPRGGGDSLDRLSRATGYKLVSQRTDYYGVCPACQDADGGAGEAKSAPR